MNFMLFNGNADARITRRRFLKITGTAALVAAAGQRAWAATDVKNGMPYRVLGRTGEKVSLLGLGGYHIGTQRDEQESVRIIRTAIDRGVNFLDNCWDYNKGVSEERMGKALRDGYRDKVFLMTKIDGRDRSTAAKQIEESLSRLQTDRIDLVQHHEIIHANDPDRIFAKGGAMEAVLEAKKAGNIRYIGFTGHKSPAMHLSMLEKCVASGQTPDAVQMPLNVMDAHYDSFEKLVLPQLDKHGVGILGMKSMGGGIILRSKAVSPTECVQYAMTLPVSVLIVGCGSMEHLESALGAAREFRPLGKDQIAELLAKTAKFAEKGEYELYKTTENFDGTTRNPQWMGNA